VSTKSVAIVDDDVSANRALARLLRGAGFTSNSFYSAESFLADPARSDFACLLLDVQLTGMSGLDLQRILLAEGTRIPIVFITAHDDPAYRLEAVRRGCVSFFRKTDPGSLVVEAVRTATGIA
jgi:FixJ family two-component response regulator